MVEVPKALLEYAEQYERTWALPPLCIIDFLEAAERDFLIMFVNGEQPQQDPDVDGCHPAAGEDAWAGEG